MRDNFDRFDGHTVLRKEWLNDIAEAVELTLRLAVSPPLTMTRLAAGLLLGCQQVDDLVTVRNDSGAARNRLEVLGITGIAYAPPTHVEDFKNQPCVTGEVPNNPDHLGKFVVLQEAVVVGGFGRGRIVGVTPVQVDVVSVAHQFADVKNADATQLQSRASGAARLLYQVNGTGTQWAFVALGILATNDAFPVKVTNDGGTTGSASTTCTFTYEVRDLAGVLLEEDVGVQAARIANVEYSAAPADSYGLACYDGATLVLLWVAKEEPLQESCP